MPFAGGWTGSWDSDQGITIFRVEELTIEEKIERAQQAIETYEGKIEGRKKEIARLKVTQAVEKARVKTLKKSLPADILALVKEHDFDLSDFVK